MDEICLEWIAAGRPLDLMFVVLYSVGNGHVLQFQIVKEASIAEVIVRLNFWCHWSVLYKAASMYWVAISTQSKIRNSYNKTNKCTNFKIIFLYTIYENSDVFWSMLIIFRELLPEYDQDRSKRVSELWSTVCVCVCVRACV
jgi:hypothetical protein